MYLLVEQIEWWLLMSPSAVSLIINIKKRDVVDGNGNLGA